MENHRRGKQLIVNLTCSSFVLLDAALCQVEFSVRCSCQSCPFSHQAAGTGPWRVLNGNPLSTLHVGRCTFSQWGLSADISLAEAPALMAMSSPLHFLEADPVADYVELAGSTSMLPNQRRAGWVCCVKLPFSLLWSIYLAVPVLPQCLPLLFL